MNMLNKQTLTIATALFLSLAAVHIALAKKPAGGGSGANHMQRGIELAQQKHFDAAALADLNKELELKPDDINGNKFRGFAELGLSQWDKAVADFTAVIQKKPDDLQSYDRRALAYRGLKNYDAAIADYTFLLSKNS